MSEKEAWEKVLGMVQRGTYQTQLFLCCNIADVLRDVEDSGATMVRMQRKVADWCERMRGSRQATMTPTRLKKIDAGFEYNQLLRAAFCRRMIHECETPQ